MAVEASSSTCRSTYEVFLSFRGKDTRWGFTDHLYTALIQTGICTFRDDDEIERGEDIQSELEKAIQESKILIIVFSKDYASSPWCLNELVMILERKRTSQHVVLPVFYNVSPCEVRHQSSEDFKKAFTRYEEKFANDDMEKVKGWRAALKQVADLGGMEFLNRYESKFIQDIVKVTEDKLNRKVLAVAPHPIRIDYQAQNINVLLQDGSTNVSIVAICGMGGIGKTTIAKHVYNLNFQSYEGSSFLANVRETSEKFNGLVRLQEQLLFDIGRKTEKLWNVDSGMSKIEKALRDRRVFIVLDDVDHLDQLNAILGMQDFLGRGSKIIITSRRERLLNANEIYKVYKVKELSYYESLELFSSHAFGQDHPVEGYMEHSRRVADLCGGLPLALKVLGSSLSGKKVDGWESAIEKLEANPDREILKTLEISYDSLQDEVDKNLFLHIACFFIGKEKDFTVKILEQCDLYPLSGIDNLVDRCLLTIDGENKLVMHDLLREMGEYIIRKATKGKLGKRSRLWRHKDSFQLLKEKSGTKKIEGLILDMCKIKENKKNGVNLETDAFTKMQELKILQLYNVQLNGCYEKFPKNLRWLCWHGFPLKTFPSDFPLKSLVVLDLRYSSFEQVWEGKELQCIGGLKILNLGHCHKLAKIPDFSGVPNILETLILIDCVSLNEVPKNIRMLKRLETLNISGCLNLALAEFPSELMMMESLKVLIADGIPANRSRSITREIKSLLIPSNWFRALIPRNLEKISLPGSLVSLSLVDCKLSNDAFPMDLSHLPLLKELDLSKNPICSLPDWVKGISRIDKLHFENCWKLKSLLGLPTVKELIIYNCNSLKKIAYQSSLCGVIFDVWKPLSHEKLNEIEGVFKLEPMSEVDAKIISYMGLSKEFMRYIAKKRPIRTSLDYWEPVQGLHEFGIFSIFFPREIPGWFGNENMGSGSSITFTVPSPRDNHRIRGLNVCFVYGIDRIFPNSTQCAFYAKIINKTKSQSWIYSPICYTSPWDRKELVWLSHWPFGNLLQGGDEVHVSMSVMGIDFKVKECGINFVYDHDEHKEEESKAHNNTTDISCEQVIGGDLSRYWVSTGVYFLSHHNRHRYEICGYDHNDPLVMETRRVWCENLNARTEEDIETAIIKPNGRPSFQWELPWDIETSPVFDPSDSDDEKPPWNIKRFRQR